MKIRWLALIFCVACSDPVTAPRDASHLTGEWRIRYSQVHVAGGDTTAVWDLRGNIVALGVDTAYAVPTVPFTAFAFGSVCHAGETMACSEFSVRQGAFTAEHDGDHILLRGIVGSDTFDIEAPLLYRSGDFPTLTHAEIRSGYSRHLVLSRY